MSIAAEKQKLRQQCQAAIGAMNADQKAAASKKICQQLLPKLADKAVVAAFLPMPDEPNIAPLFSHLQTKGTRVAFPTEEKSGHLFFVDQSGTPVAPADIDVVLVPGLAFTPAGHRLGRGGGCYDRCLQALPKTATTIGLCFSCSYLPELPTEKHDQRVSLFVSA